MQSDAVRLTTLGGCGLVVLCFLAAPAQAQDSFPKSIRVPGTDIAVKLGGYVKLDFIHDFDAIGDAFEFSTKTIPTGGAAADLGPRNTIHAKETRISLEVRALAKVTAFVEGDFYGSGSAFRLRHAYGKYGRLLAGQTWSTFQDISARPLTVDFEGPDGEVFVRQAMLQWTQPLSKSAHWAIALEDAVPQFSIPGTVTGVAQASWPDVTSNIRFTGARGHVQFAGALRQIRFDGQGTSSDVSTTGWGLHGSFRYRVAGKDEFMGMAVHGQGIGRYIESFNGQGVDAVLEGGTELNTIPSTAVTIGFIHHWSGTVKSGLSYSQADLDPDPSLAAGSIEQTRDARLNVVVTPYHLVDFGTEVLYGRRRDVSGATGEAWRFQFAVIYRLN